MAMTRKDYTLVAKAFASQREDIRKRGTIALRTLEQSIETMAAHFSLMNDNFKKDVFIKVARGEEKDNE